MNPLHSAKKKGSSEYDDVPLEDEVKEEAKDDEEEEEDWVDKQIESLGFGVYQRRLLVLSAGLWMSDSMEVSLLSFLYQCVGASMSLTKVEAASIVSIVFAGELLGALVAGPLGDACGRKPVSIAASFLVAFAGLATAASWNLSSFIAFRFLVGVGVGGLAVPFDLMAEFLPASTRGENLTLLEFAWAGGAMYATLACYLTQSRWSWRALVLACSFPFFIVFAGVLLFLDESPRWLAAHGKDQRAKKVLERVAKVNRKEEVIEEGEVRLARASSSSSRPSIAESCNDVRRQLVRLFSRHLRRTTILVWIVWLGFGLVFYGVSLLTTRLFARRNDGGFECKFRYGFIFTITTAQVAGIIALLLLLNRLGRVGSQSYSYVATALSLAPIAFFAERPGLPHLACLYLALGAQMMASSASWVHITELYPTDVRSSAHSIALTVSRLSAFSASYVVDSTLSLFAVLAILSAASLAAAGAAAALPETKGVALK